jgi:hypothetical protein
MFSNEKITLNTPTYTSTFSQEIIVDKTIPIVRDESSQEVIDYVEGLVWQDDKRVKTVRKNWREAKAYRDSFKGWYLPSKEELTTILDKENKPTIKRVFMQVSPRSYWSSSQDKTDSSRAYYVSFYSANLNKVPTTFEHNIMCVRKKESYVFENIVNKLISEELSNIPKPPKEIKLVKNDFKSKKVAIKVERHYTKEFKEYLEQLPKDSMLQKMRKMHPELDEYNDEVFSEAFRMTYYPEMTTNEFLLRTGIKSNVEAVFDYDGENVKLKDIRVLYKNHNYLAQFTDMNINETRVAVNLKTDELKLDNSFDTKISVAQNEVNSFDTSKLTNYSELDNLLKNSKALKTSKKKWLFVVGIENYEYTDNIVYAKRSAQMFAKTAQKKLGVPKQNSFVLINDNATQAEIKTNMRRMLSRVKSGDTIYFYYNGHGVPVPSLNNEPFMLPSNSEPDYIADEKYFSLKNIYSKLSESKADKVVAFVDSCFSGVTQPKSSRAYSRG